MNKVLVILALLLAILVAFYPCRYVWEGYRQFALRQLAIDTISAFNKHKVVYWVDYGTLLGIVRENDIIRHDNDVDICMLDFEDNHSRVRKAIKSLGNKYSYTYRSWGAYRVHRFGGFAFVDIYITEEKDGMYIDGTGKIPKKLVGTPTTIKWKGVDVPVPEKTHDALVWRYGKDYMTPKRDGETVDGNE
jgi:phosphorylcholine metabolism protein LicD